MQPATLRALTIAFLLAWIAAPYVAALLQLRQRKRTARTLARIADALDRMSPPPA